MHVPVYAKYRSEDGEFRGSVHMSDLNRCENELSCTRSSRVLEFNICAPWPVCVRELISFEGRVPDVR